MPWSGGIETEKNDTGRHRASPRIHRGRSRRIPCIFPRPRDASIVRACPLHNARYGYPIRASPCHGTTTSPGQGDLAFKARAGAKQPQAPTGWEGCGPEGDLCDRALRDRDPTLQKVDESEREPRQVRHQPHAPSGEGNGIAGSQIRASGRQARVVPATSHSALRLEAGDGARGAEALARPACQRRPSGTPQSGVCP